jgi:hypothetical protein
LFGLQCKDAAPRCSDAAANVFSVMRRTSDKKGGALHGAELIPPNFWHCHPDAGEARRGISLMGN